MIVWRLKRGDFENSFKFDVTFSNASNKWIVFKDKKYICCWDAAFGSVMSNNVVTVDDVTFIADLELEPEVIRESDGHFEYYLSQDGVRISEIPLQNSANELVLEISDRSKEYPYICEKIFVNASLRI